MITLLLMDGSILGNFDVASYTVGVLTGGIIVLISLMIRSAKERKRLRSQIDQTYEHIGTHTRKILEHAQSIDEERTKLLAELTQLKNDLSLNLDEVEGPENSS